MKLPAIRQLPSGNWFCRVRIDGKDIGITEPSKEKCQARALAYKTGVLETKKAPANMTLREACNDYIDMRRGVCAASTIESYEKNRDQYFASIMDKRLKDINEGVLQKAISLECNRPSRRGGRLSAATINDRVAFIKTVMRAKGVDIDNGKIKTPEKKRKMVRIPPPPDVLHAIQGTDIELACLLAAWLSLSMSEIRGLTKSKSIYNGQLYVVETLVRVKRQDVRKEGGKEEERSRALDIPPYIQKLIDQVPGDVLVPLTGKQIYGRFKKAIAAAGLPPMTFHQLRHLNASAMAMLGVQKEIARERGGWKTNYVMDRVYTHTFAPERKAADAVIDAYFSAQLKPQNGNEKATATKKHKVFRLVKP